MEVNEDTKSSVSFSWLDSSFLLEQVFPPRRGLRGLVRRSTAGSHCTSNLNRHPPLSVFSCTNILYEDIPALSTKMIDTIFALGLFDSSFHLVCLDQATRDIHGRFSRKFFFLFFFCIHNGLHLGLEAMSLCLAALACLRLGRDTCPTKKDVCGLITGMRPHGIKFPKRLF